MNLWDSRFDRLHAAQTRQLGVDIRATVGSVVSNAKAILGTVSHDDSVVDGGAGQRGGYELQIKASDFVATPERDAACTVNGFGSGTALVLTRFEHRGGVYVLTVGDPAML